MSGVGFRDVGDWVPRCRRLVPRCRKVENNKRYLACNQATTKSKANFKHYSIELQQEYRLVGFKVPLYRGKRKSR